MDNCERVDCKNTGSSACNRCMNHSLYKKKSSARLGHSQNSQKEGMAFQRKVQKMHDKSVSKSSRQCLNSGALWFDPGDIITERDLIECKERKLTARGEKSFTITEEILSKIEEEAGGSRKGMVAFGFKGKDKVYCIADYNLWLELVQTIELLQKQLDGNAD